MSNDADNQAEQWLKAYSRKRREEQGPLPQLHPATRRVLQSEAALHWRATTDAAPADWGAILWRWSLGSAVAAVIVITATLSWFGPRQHPGGTSGNVAKNTPAPQPAAAHPDKNSIPVTGAAADVDLGAKRVGGQLEAQSARKATETGKGALAATAKEAKQDGADRRSSARSARSGEGVSLADAQEQAISNQKSRQQYQQLYRNEQQAKADVTASKDWATQVLAEFVLQREGDSVQLRDRDGSVYSGKVLFANEPERLQGLPLAAVGVNRSALVGALPAGPKKGLGGAVGPAPQPPVAPPPAGGVRPVIGAVPPAVPTVPEAPVVLPNDNVANSIAIRELGQMIIGHNLRATPEAGVEQGLPNFHGRSVWWTATTAYNGEVTVSTRGSNFDTTLGVFVPAGAAVRPLVYTDAAGQGIGLVLSGNVSDGPSHELRFQGVTNGRYLIAVDGVGGATGKIHLMVRQDSNKTGQAIAALSPEPSAFYFQVAGTNRSTQQRVEFTGYSVGEGQSPMAPRVMATAGGGFGGGAAGGAGAAGPAGGKAEPTVRRLNASPSQQSLMQSRVEGRARVGRADLAIQANAAEATPTAPTDKPGEKR